MSFLEGEKIIIEGVILRSGSYRAATNSISDGKNLFELIYSYHLEEGSCFRVSGEIVNFRGILKLKVLETEPVPNSVYEKTEKKAMDSAPIKEQFIYEDETTRKLKEKIILFSRKLYAAMHLRKNCAVRFHNDGDGICGAICINLFLKGEYIQQNSAIYSIRDAMRDISNLSNSKHPLLVLVDFGSNEESFEALSLIKSAKIEVLIIDHHPVFEKTMEGFEVLNFWETKNPLSSKYTAGYICAEISHLLGNDSTTYAKIALNSDKSDLMDYTLDEKNAGLVLNYAAAYSSHQTSLNFYRSILKNKDLFDSMLYQAQDKIDQLVSVSRNQMKEKKIKEFNLYYLNLGALVKKFEFPGLGKSATQIFDALIPKDKPSILLCYGPKSIVLRLNDLAVEKGANANEIIEYLKSSAPGVIESGGGHIRAAAIRVREEFEKSMIDEIINYLENLN
ncbi:MAG: DHH family phosphoesterase [Candidatus Micrarchaeia archaeon]